MSIVIKIGGMFLEFCPSCKSFMVPKGKGSKTVLVCSRCGKKVTKFSAAKYKITESGERKRGEISVIEEDAKKDTEEQRKYLIDLYGREFYDSEE